MKDNFCSAILCRTNSIETKTEREYKHTCIEIIARQNVKHIVCRMFIFGVFLGGVGCYFYIFAR